MKFEAPKGRRLHRYFWAITVFDPYLWWNHTLRKWEDADTNKGHDYSTHAPCKTLRAFARHLRKHPEIKGKCVLVNKYTGYNVYA